MIFTVSLVCTHNNGILLFTYTRPLVALWHMMKFNRPSFLRVESNVCCTKHRLPFTVSKFLHFIHHLMIHIKMKA
jgi:hypothetical protein